MYGLPTVTTPHGYEIATGICIHVYISVHVWFAHCDCPPWNYWIRNSDRYMYRCMYMCTYVVCLCVHMWFAYCNYMC